MPRHLATKPPLRPHPRLHACSQFWWPRLLAVVRPSEAEDVMSIEFGKFSVGALPPGFSTGLTGRGKAVAWTVLEDPSAPSGRALAEISGDTTDYRFPLAIYDDQRQTNVAVTVHFKPVAGRVDRAG